MFKIGDKIVYPMHGAGTIVGIETRKILGEIHEYYVLSIPVGDMKVMIPTDNLDEIGIRDISTEKEADEVIDVFKTCDEEIMENNWNFCVTEKNHCLTLKEKCLTMQNTFLCQNWCLQKK